MFYVENFSLTFTKHVIDRVRERAPDTAFLDDAAIRAEITRAFDRSFDRNLFGAKGLYVELAGTRGVLMFANEFADSPFRAVTFIDKDNLTINEDDTLGLFAYLVHEDEVEYTEYSTP